MAVKYTTMIGIADAHGIESYLPLEGNERQLALFEIRAMFNRQRHAVAYMAKVSPKVNRLITNYIETEDFPKALTVLKERGLDIKLTGGGDVQDSWQLIPNAKLDPWA